MGITILTRNWIYDIIDLHFVCALHCGLHMPNKLDGIKQVEKQFCTWGTHSSLFECNVDWAAHWAYFPFNEVHLVVLHIEWFTTFRN